jgi:hypothetical protein
VTATAWIALLAATNTVTAVAVVLTARSARAWRQLQAMSLATINGLAGPPPPDEWGGHR